MVAALEEVVAAAAEEVVAAAEEVVAGCLVQTSSVASRAYTHTSLPSVGW